MDVSFDTAGLAALCNSERLMAERWGPDLGRTIGRRLLDLAASTSQAIDRIPTARVDADGLGDTTVTFAGPVVIRGRIDSSGASGNLKGDDEERFVIATVDAPLRGSR
jgi:hypothetical protein